MGSRARLMLAQFPLEKENTNIDFREMICVPSLAFQSCFSSVQGRPSAESEHPLPLEASLPIVAAGSAES